jgi:hypothetical protein
MTTAVTSTGNDPPITTFQALTDRERDRLRLLARRYRIRAGTTLRPVTDVTHDLRSLPGARLTVGQVLDLLSRRAAR